MLSLILLPSSLLQAGNTAQNYVKRLDTLAISNQILICMWYPELTQPAILFLRDA